MNHFSDLKLIKDLTMNEVIDVNDLALDMGEFVTNQFLI